jgi:outer membrane protein assembly factor BamE (lipoprotein component of BamABCDE complex)
MSNKSSKAAQSKRTNRLPIRGAGVAYAAALAGTLVLSACANNVIREGHQFQEEDLAQIHEGMTKDQVTLALGTPDTQSAVNGGAYYYISQTAVQRAAFMAPEVTDRHVIAVYFNNKDRVQQISNYGLQDGKVVDFVKRQTPTYTHDKTLLQELFRNVGASPTIPGMGRDSSR